MSPIQTDFRAALLDPEHPVPAGLTDGDGAPTTKRFDVYRNNVTVALIEALRTAFPVLRKLLGDPNFDQLAPLYARAHPPHSPLMMHYGADMPDFLEGSAPLRHLGYLPDIARLELALRRSYHAADAQPMAAEALAACPPDLLMASTLKLAPAVELLRSDWPIFEIWAYNTTEDAPKPQPGAQTILITRPEFDPVPNALSPTEADWFAAIAAGKTLSDAQDAATATDPEFDLTPLLTLLLQQGALTSLSIPKD